MKTCDELLPKAFRGFERAAEKLELSHGVLGRRIEQLQDELIESHRRLEAVVDALDTGVAVLSRDGRVVRANRAFEDLRLDESRRQEMLRDLRAGAHGRSATIRVRHPDASGTRDLSVTWVPVGDGAQESVLTVHDVTAIRREEEEGGRRRRLEALGRMAAELAHEVRNPLGSIRLLARMLCQDLGAQPDQRELAEQILGATSSLEATVANLLDFASPSRAAARRFDLRELAADIASTLAPSCAVRGVALEGPSGGDVPVEGDPEGLRRVVLNLVGNALAATDSGGRIRIDVSRHEDLARFRVADTGRGIPAEELPRVFDPFFSRSEGGTGLGLSVVHRIVEQHGGRIWIDSAVGQGTCASFEVPAVVPAEETTP